MAFFRRCMAVWWMAQRIQRNCRNHQHLMYDWMVGSVYFQRQKRYLIWPDMIWVYILVYDVWNFAYTYNCLPTHTFLLGVARRTDNRLFWNKGGWIMNRANTLCIWCMFAQVFPLFQETFSDGTQVFPRQPAKIVCSTVR